MTAEELYESIGGDLCSCQRVDMPHWCEKCQWRIALIASAIPQAHEQPASVDAVDPHVADPGKPSPRVKDSDPVAPSVSPVPQEQTHEDENTTTTKKS